MTKTSKYDNIVEVVVGVLVINNQGEILVANGEKWKWHYTIPGGHIEYGEKMIDAARREVKEETGLVLKKIEVQSVDEAVFPEYFHRKAHFVFVNFVAWIDDGREVTLCEKEFAEHMWIDPKKALQEVKLKSSVRGVIKKYIDQYVQGS